MKRKVCLVVLACILLTACTNAEIIKTDGIEIKRQGNRYDTGYFAMDTYMTITAYGDNAKEALLLCMKEIDYLEECFSVNRGSIREINQNTGAMEKTPVNKDTFSAIQMAIDASSETGGAFDITVYPLVKLWGFISEEHAEKEYYVPSDGQLLELLKNVGYEKIRLGNSSVGIEAGMGIDLGGIAKGYTSDRLSDIFRQQGVESAIISLGGNIHAVGKKPDATNWKIGIQDPLHANDAGRHAGVVSVSDKAIITSGGYQRNFTQNGKTYHHILNPQDGKPSNSGIISVTIISENGARSDALSTALFVMGEQGAISHWREFGGYEAVVITDDMRILVTQGLKDSFEKSNENEYKLEIIEK